MNEKELNNLKEHIDSGFKAIKKRNEEIVEQRVATAMWGQSKFFLSFLIVFIAGFGLIVNLLINNKDDMTSMKDDMASMKKYMKDDMVKMKKDITDKIESSLKNINQKEV